MRSCRGPINGKISHIVVSGDTSINNYKLPIASDKVLGGIKISEDLTITDDGVVYINIEALSEKLLKDFNDKTYEHRQNSPSKIWKIKHNLNKKPSATVTDSAGSQVIGDVIYIDNNNVELHFSAPFSGVAYLN